MGMVCHTMSYIHDMCIPSLYGRSIGKLNYIDLKTHFASFSSSPHNSAGHLHQNLKMRFLLFLPFLALSAAQNIFSNQTTVQSAPFNLVIHSHNHTLNGALLGACHDGAAREALCAIPKSQIATYGNNSADFFTYKLNTTYSLCYYDNGTVVPDCGTPSVYLNNPSGYAGTIVWDMPYTEGSTGLPATVSQPLGLELQGASSNMAFAIIQFTESYEYYYLAFDKENKLNYQDSLNKAKTGPDEGVVGGDFPVPKAYYSWYVCTTQITSYTEDHLVWVYGDGDPSDKQCEKVDVYRVFI